MAIYGAKGLQWAQKTAAGVEGTSFPTYDTPISLGPLVSVADTITYSTAENYGDNVLQEFVNEFQRMDVTVGMTEMPIESAAAVYGATKNAQGGLSYNAEDSAPEGGLGFYTTKITKGNDGVQKKYFQGVFYPNLKGSRQGATYNTKGSSITFANGQANFTGTTEENGFYQVFSGNLETEAAAKEWVALMLAGGEEALTAAKAATV